MTIHAVYPQEAGTASEETGDATETTDDTSAAPSTAYDSVWAGEEVPAATAAPPEQPEDALERTMLSNDKLYVVLAVVLLIWLGLAFLIFRTDRRLTRLERSLDDTN